ncbi:hypothetical protein [Microcoleus sp. FACHB-672]|uniref:hypothetical protein n=1 Tax=Microcoleus sp. FACHB-672 TaxID=2692825 RepID=UPI0016823891|nr:hypothetical protein [Microcoleus sp. FACHB-672]MBD2042283.1 hypothetical protein [Microcoleus sp. FACHB-672]
MNREMINLLAPVVTEDAEKLLENYTNCVYKKDFVISHWHQELTAYVLSHLP